MGLLDFFKRSSSKRRINKLIQSVYGGNLEYFVYNYANNIYNIPEVRTAIEKVSDIFASMQIYHKRINEKGYIEYINDRVDKILNYKPNTFQNGTQFFKSVVSKLLLDSNAFIQPIFDDAGRLTMLYQIDTKSFNFSQDADTLETFVTFNDSKTASKKYNLDELIYISRFCSMGGGQKTSIGLYEQVIKSLGEQIVNVAKPNKPRAIIRSNVQGSGKLKEADRDKVKEEVSSNFDNNIQGIAYIDKMWDIVPINWNENDVNRDLMKFVISIVYNYFGINENIINNTASEIEMAMFVNTTIKPLAQQFEKEFTNKLFTDNEYYFGNRIEFDYQPLLITTMSAKTALAQTGLRNGFFNIDETREMFGYSPLADGSGQVYRTSADLVNIKVVDEYQLGKVDKEVSTASADDINARKEETDGQKEE